MLEEYTGVRCLPWPWPTLLTDAPQTLEPAGCAGEVTEEDWTGCSQKVKKDKELLGEGVQGQRLLSPVYSPTPPSPAPPLPPAPEPRGMDLTIAWILVGPGLCGIVSMI